MQICPICGKEYTNPPAISRRDGITQICPDCGVMEALDDAKEVIGPEMNPGEWETFKLQILLAIESKHK